MTKVFPRLSHLIALWILGHSHLINNFALSICLLLGIIRPMVCQRFPLLQMFWKFFTLVNLVWDPLSIIYPNSKVELGEFESGYFRLRGLNLIGGNYFLLERKYVKSDCDLLGLGCINGGLLLERQIGFYIIYAFIPSDRDSSIKTDLSSTRER